MCVWVGGWVSRDPEKVGLDTYRGLGRADRGRDMVAVAVVLGGNKRGQGRWSKRQDRRARGLGW